MALVDDVRDLVGADHHRVLLYEAMVKDVRRVVEASADGRFSVSSPWSDDAFRARVAASDDAFRDLRKAQVMLGAWAPDVARQALLLAPRRLTDFESGEGGNSVWLALRGTRCWRSSMRPASQPSPRNGTTIFGPF